MIMNLNSDLNKINESMKDLQIVIRIIMIVLDMKEIKKDVTKTKKIIKSRMQSESFVFCNEMDWRSELLRELQRNRF